MKINTWPQGHQTLALLRQLVVFTAIKFVHSSCLFT